jgi:hypothetical protein
MSDKKKTTKKIGRPKGTQKNKMNKAEVVVFKKEAMRKILNEHYSWREFTNWCMEVYGISEAQGTNYWKSVWEDIKNKFELERDKLVNKHLQKYWNIHDEALERGDLNTARQTLNDIGKLQGLNEPDKVDINTKGEITFKFGDEE